MQRFECTAAPQSPRPPQMSNDDDDVNVVVVVGIFPIHDVIRGGVPLY